MSKQNGDKIAEHARSPRMTDRGRVRGFSDAAALQGMTLFIYSASGGNSIRGAAVISLATVLLAAARELCLIVRCSRSDSFADRPSLKGREGTPNNLDS